MTQLDQILASVHDALASASPVALGAAADEALSWYRDTGELMPKMAAVYAVAAASAIDQGEPQRVIDELDAILARLNSDHPRRDPGSNRVT